MNALKKILIIDDLPELHLIYKMMLLRYQCEIISALNGQDGLDRLAKHPDIDLILLDINMPLMTGLDFIRAVNNTASFRSSSSAPRAWKAMRGKVFGSARKDALKSPLRRGNCTRSWTSSTSSMRNHGPETPSFRYVVRNLSRRTTGGFAGFLSFTFIP
ncbi:MAG: response regulator [Nitrospiraceae bacterium]|nr:response regulator [Nitrospiraceae bacterium]